MTRFLPIPSELAEKLLQQGKQPVGDDPLLLAKLIDEENWHLFLISMYVEEPHGLALCYFDPACPLGFSQKYLSRLENTCRLCPDFKPIRLSEFDRTPYQ